jgi:signal transduction histidine kinase
MNFRNQVQNYQSYLTQQERNDELQFKTLRKKLTVSFAFVSLLIYSITALMALVIFSSFLNSSIKTNLNRLLTDIGPAVKLEDGRLSLKDWSAMAGREHLRILHVVQLFDRQGRLTEEYGVPGVRTLSNGILNEVGRYRRLQFRSKFISVLNAGFLQVQIETKQTDDALAHFLTTILMLVPVVAVTAAIFGYVFCGKAVAPISQNFKLLRRFVDDAGHELKTPVAVISASLETLERTIAENQQSTSIIEKASRASQRLRNLSNGLILLASLESPALKLELELIDTSTLIRQVSDDFKDIASDKGVILKETESSSTLVLGNVDALNRLLTNLVENAIRYTPAGGTVSISNGIRHAQVVITVEDTGIGIPNDSLGQIFDRFYRVDPSRARDQGAAGLGLSIAKAIVEAHSGSIIVESKLNQGTVFVVTLPRHGSNI